MCDLCMLGMISEHVPVPDWAGELINNVLEQHKDETKRKPQLHVTWFMIPNGFPVNASTAMTPNRSEINVYAIDDPWRMKGILLHELAHFLTISTKAQRDWINLRRPVKQYLVEIGHCEAFFQKAFGLYMQYAPDDYQEYMALDALNWQRPHNGIFAQSYIDACMKGPEE